mgnify:CR=1 FL=1
MIQRRDTLGFVEFMRGKYNLDNVFNSFNKLEISADPEVPITEFGRRKRSLQILSDEKIVIDMSSSILFKK